MKKYDVAIIGAGTAGLAARRQVAKKTNNYIIIDSGPLGTTCARVGCMPSKVLIQSANDFHRKYALKEQGISGAENLKVDKTKLMQHVRSLRDRFTRSVTSSVTDYEDKLVRKKATFIDKNIIDLEGEKVWADKIIIATGSRPIIPGPWQKFKNHIIDTNDFFELETLPDKMAVIGLGVIGIELGQALNRVGVDVIGIGLGKEIGGITDPEIQDYIINKLSKEMPIYTNGAELIDITKENRLKIKVQDSFFEVDKALISVGRKANIDQLGLENLGIKLDSKGFPDFSRTTFKLTEAPHIFLAGDVNADRPILHEAADEGVIAGFNAVNNEQCFKRRTSLGITFSDPNIATIGQRYQDLQNKNIMFSTGKVSFEGQGRSIVKLKESGMLKIYADNQTQRVLGAELFAPDGEHLAHLIAWGITMNLTVKEMLAMPFYHPVIEEGLRTALRDLQVKLNPEDFLEVMRCQEHPIR